MAEQPCTSLAARTIATVPVAVWLALIGFGISGLITWGSTQAQMTALAARVDRSDRADDREAERLTLVLTQLGELRAEVRGLRDIILRLRGDVGGPR